MGIIGCALIEISALLQLSQGRLLSWGGETEQTKWKMEALYTPVAFRYKVYSSHSSHLQGVLFWSIAEVVALIDSTACCLGPHPSFFSDYMASNQYDLRAWLWSCGVCSWPLLLLWTLMKAPNVASLVIEMALLTILFGSFVLNVLYINAI